MSCTFIRSETFLTTLVRREKFHKTSRPGRSGAKSGEYGEETSCASPATCLCDVKKDVFVEKVHLPPPPLPLRTFFQAFRRQSSRNALQSTENTEMVLWCLREVNTLSLWFN